MSRFQTYRAELLYADPDSGTQFFRGWILPDNTLVVIKEVLFPSLQEAANSVEQARAMQYLDHPNIRKTYDCYVDQAEDGFAHKTVTLLEYLDCNVSQEIEYRKTTGMPWNDGELIGILRMLVSALDYASKQGLFHGAINPVNIGKVGNCYKVCEFGMQVNMTAQEPTSYFKSPELRQFVSETIRTRRAQTGYDPWKADVYSLGVTLMHMAYLHPPLQLATEGGLDVITEELIRGLDQYHQLQYYLSYMLAVQHSERPTIQDLEKSFREYDEAYFRGTYNPYAQTYSPESSTPQDTAPQMQFQTYTSGYPPSAYLTSPTSTTLSTCKGCRKSFIVDSSYPAPNCCSRACSRASEKTCTVCQEVIRDQEWLEGYADSGFGQFAADCCSQKCVLQLHEVCEEAKGQKGSPLKKFIASASQLITPIFDVASGVLKIYQLVQPFLGKKAP